MIYNLNVVFIQIYSKNIFRLTSMVGCYHNWRQNWLSGNHQSVGLCAEELLGSLDNGLVSNCLLNFAQKFMRWAKKTFCINVMFSCPLRICYMYTCCITVYVLSWKAFKWFWLWVSRKKISMMKIGTLGKLHLVNKRWCPCDKQKKKFEWDLRRPLLSCQMSLAKKLD